MKTLEHMATEYEYELAITKGQRLLTLLLADDLGAGQFLDPPQPSAQSSFTSAQDLPKHGYIQHYADTHKTRREFQSLVQALGLNPSMARDWGHNIRVNHSHPTNKLFNQTKYDVRSLSYLSRYGANTSL
jgi:hypothetical protein